MRKRKILLCIALSLTLVGCQSASKSVSDTQSTEVIDSTTASGDENDQTSEESTDTAITVSSEVVQFAGDYSEKALDASWSESESTKITLNGDSIEATADGVQVDGSTATITKGGTYVLSGTLNDGRIFVNLSEDENVQLVLNGASISCSNSAPITILSAKNTFLTLADGTQNTVSDGETYEFADDTDEPSAAIYSADDLVINGTGSLTVHANYKDGITGKDEVQIVDGNITVHSKDDGIVGKDSVSIRTGQLTINAGGDGIKSTNAEDATKGFVVIDGGNIKITAGADGIQAETQLMVNDGTFDIVTNGGSANATPKTQEQSGKGGMKDGMSGGGMHGDWNGDKSGTPPQAPGDAGTDGTMPDDSTTPEDSDSDGSTASNSAGIGDATASDGVAVIRTSSTEATVTDNATASDDTAVADKASTDDTTEDSEEVSAKALKSGANIGIFGGTFSIDSADDAIHGNQTVLIQAGELTLASGDDGIHSDEKLEINGGTVTISKSYEGIEGHFITINDGKIDVISSDDGINDSGDSSTTSSSTEQNEFAATDGVVTINGGTLNVNADGDGLDSNGSIVMTGGTVTVSGPTNDGNGALDYNGTFDVSGGTLLVVGSAGMAQTPSDSSTQSYLAVGFSSTIAGGTEITVKNASGEVIYSYTPTKDYAMAVISGSDITAGETYTLTAGSETVTLTGGEASNLSSGMGGGGHMR